MRSCHTVLLAFILLFSFSWTLAQAPPKREFRGAWIATVSNLDWPTSRTADPITQQSQLITILDGLKAAGINAVVFQVRPECDALYFSMIEPWSYWLTGQQGKAPISAFDPLTFAVIEAHKRGMELHAWFNPYRVISDSTALSDPKHSSYRPLAPTNVAVVHPDWVIKVGKFWLLNPGMQAVRNFVVSVIVDVVRRYDIEGVHFDDYFYQDGTGNQDAATFAVESRSFFNIADWRRDNVNLLLKQINDSIQAIKPNVKWGISPRGIYKNGVPAGITGNDNYSTIFTDAVAWLQGKYIDYLAPQLYWPFGGPQDYAKLMPWWSSVKNGRHLYIGQAPYRIVDASNWSATELPRQVRLNRVNAQAEGSIYFRANMGINDNPKGFKDSLMADLYKYPALRPIMSWKETIPPKNPQSLTIAKFSSSAFLGWTAPPVASDGGLADQYVVYRSTSLPINMDDARNIVSIPGSTNYVENSLPPPGVTYYYGVTALDRLQNESGLSNVMGLTVVGIEEQTPVIADFKLYQNYPNPFNPTTIIAFHLPSEQHVSLRIFDLLGREVRVLADGVISAGGHRFQFNGSGLSSGVYIYRVVAGNHVASRKMQLLK